MKVIIEAPIILTMHQPHYDYARATLHRLGVTVKSAIAPNPTGRLAGTLTVAQQILVTEFKDFEETADLISRFAANSPDILLRRVSYLTYTLETP